jgi:hypothetical protein
MIRKYNRWTSAQLNRLRQHYPTMPRHWLEVDLAPHSIESITRMACKLGIRRRRDWLAVARKYTPMIFSVPQTESAT